MAPSLPPAHADFLWEVFRYDCLTRPIFDNPGVGEAYRSQFQVVEIAGEPYYWRPAVQLAYDVPGILRHFEREGEWDIEQRPTEVGVFSKAGFYKYYANHEEGVYFVGKTAEDLQEAETQWQPLAPILPGAVVR
jgi:hypothetical protein